MSSKMLAFIIEGDELERVKEFMEEHSACDREMYGGRYTFEFYPSHHGMPKVVTCVCGESLYLEPESDTGGEIFEDLF